MAIVNKSEVKVGIMVILASVLLVALTIAVGNFQSFFSDTVTLSILVPSVVGLESSAEVTYSGVRIGLVKQILYDNELQMVVVRAEIAEDSPVSIDSEARFTAASMLSPLFIDITGGTPEKRISTLLEQGKIDRDDISINATPYMSIGDVFALAGDVKNLLGKVEEILDQIYDPLSKFGGFVSDVSREVQVALTDVRELIHDSRPQVSQLLTNVNGMITSASEDLGVTLNNIERSSEEIPKILADTREGLNDFLLNASGMITSVSPEIVKTTQSMRDMMESLQEQLDTIREALVVVLKDADSLIVNNQEEVNRIVLHLERTMINLDRLIEQLARDPSLLLWGAEERRNPPRLSPKWEPLDSQ